MSLTFPFSAIVGQDEMKLAILIAAVDPSVGGVLVFGDRGTACVQVPDSVLERAAELCMKLGTDGLRGELTLMRAARVLAELFPA